MYDWSNILIWIAVSFSLLVLLAHEFLGAPMVLPPLSKADLPDNVIWLHHFSWHVGTVAIGTLITLYVYSALVPGNLAMTVIATGMSFCFALLGLGFAIFANKVLWTTPAPYAWTILTMIGGAAILTAGS